MTPEKNLYDFVMAMLEAKVRPQREIADGSGVPFGTVTKIAQREIKNPGVHTVQKLADYFRGLESSQSCHSCCASADRKAA